MEQMTFGEIMVRVNFNPGANQQVEETKKVYAALIDKFHKMKEETTNPDLKRLCSEVITQNEQACMWAVKALTL